MKIYIAICSCRDWKPQFGTSLANLRAYERKIEGLEAVYLNSLRGTSVIPRARQLAIQDAINGGFSHILMIDDDMEFSPDMLDGFLKRNVPIVALNYVRKDGSGITMTCGMDGSNVISKGKSGIEEVAWIPFGGILIELDKIKDIPKPWFEMRWLTERNDFMGEDFYFSMKARTHGVKIYIDHDQSNKCAHIGDYSYKEV